jgi:hypothetical protein
MQAVWNGAASRRSLTARAVTLLVVSFPLLGRLRGEAWPSPPADFTGSGRWMLNPPQHARVHLGCGDRYLRGYLNVDLPPEEGVAAGTSRPDLESDVTKVACPPETLEEIRLHHLFEHFDRADALALLIRWHRWLRPDGRIRIETPDFEGCIEKFGERPIGEQTVILRHIFGSQEAPWAVHRDGWSENRFRYVLGELGFDRISTARTYSDPRQLLPNVLVTAHRTSGVAASPEVQLSRALGILRQSMNGQSPTEETLFERWRAQFEAMCAEDACS